MSSATSNQEAPLPSFDVHEGAGPPLLLVHSMLSSRAQWEPNLTALRSVASPVVVELFGHARSPSPTSPEPYHQAAYVAAVARIRARLGAERWLVCGQSLGAALTLRYALRFPERVIAQVFTNSNSAFADPTWEERIRRGVDRIDDEVARDGRAALERMPVHPRHSRRMPAALRDALVADADLHSPEGIARTMRFTVPPSSVRSRVEQLRVPTLLALGTRETRFAEDAKFARETIPGLVLLELDAGHAVNLEAARDFNRGVLDFFARALRRCSPTSTGGEAEPSR
jgi:pimeloyl-ACP methyl ester carboxylesterase